MTKDKLCIKLVFLYAMILCSRSTLALSRAVCNWWSLPGSATVIKAEWPSTLHFVTKQSTMAAYERGELINFFFLLIRAYFETKWLVSSFLFYFLVLDYNSYVLSNFIFKNWQRSPGSYTGCPARYRTRHFFNNFTNNEDIATKFEANLPHCVRSVREKERTPVQISLQYLYWC